MMKAMSRSIETYRRQRDHFLDLQERADQAFARYFTKLQAGVATNGAAASRLANEANYASADLHAAENVLYGLGVDPDVVDQADGVEREVLNGSSYS